MKKRSIQHIIDARGKAKLESLLSQWIVNELTDDYGFDYEVRITEELDSKDREVSPISFYIQLKSTGNEEEERFEDFSISDLILFQTQSIPVVFFRYYDGTEKIYWEIFQDYIFNELEIKNPSWMEQKYCRIYGKRELDSLTELKDRVILIQKQIYRRALLSLSAGEGLNFSREKLEELVKHKERNLEEIAEISLFEALIHQKDGNLEKARSVIHEIYSSQIEDERKIKAIIYLLDTLDTTQEQNMNKSLELINEGKDIASKIDKPDYFNYLLIREHEFYTYNLVKQYSQIRLGLLIQKQTQKDFFSFFFNEELRKIVNDLLISETKISESLTYLINNNIILYFIALSTILKILTVKVMFFSAFDKEILTTEKKLRERFLALVDFILKLNINDEIKMGILANLSHYYYQTKQPKKALSTLEHLTSIATKTSDRYFQEFSSKFTDRIQKEPDPYDAKLKQSIFPDKPKNKFTSKEFSDIIRKSIEMQGVNLESNDDLTQNIKIAIEDLDRTSYYLYCEHLHIEQISTSPLGESIGLESLGSKIIWCKYGENFIQALSLKQTFNRFKEENCKDCKYHTPRKKDTEFTIEWVQNFEKDPQFQEFLRKIRNSV